MIRGDVTTETEPAQTSGFLAGTEEINPEVDLAFLPKKVVRKRTILVVDDDKVALALFARLLTEGGFDVVAAESGFQCLDQFRNRPWVFDLVLLDLNMPLMDGEEVFERLKTIRPDVAVILCTGLIQQERLDRLLKGRFVGFLRKPLDPKSVASAVRSALQSTAYARLRGGD
jgi:CheY-like chemotaxis protein